MPKTGPFTKANEFKVDRQHVEASDGPTGQGSDSSSVTHYKNIVHLWEFLLELLADESCRSIITWSNENRMEFKIKVPDEVAKRWGQFKRTRTMTYDKLSRALRFYYSKGIIQKVPKQRLVYRFHKLPYKYEPGVTRWRPHGQRIKACITQNESSVTTSEYGGHGINSYIGQRGAGINLFIGQRQTFQKEKPITPPLMGHDWSSAFTPVITPFRRSRVASSFLPTSTTLHPALSCHDPVFNTSSPFQLRSRIIFPDDINPGFRPVKQVKPVGHDMQVKSTTASSIPVSVIQRI
ncbi:uncharacterized protein [Porites lutea]|uniref:uncharacterized protein isoform X2 n=1 Tax=Porites lutea TaxID=51062 RepID=UPI003CC5F1EA